jgi:hypothetical protein
MRSLTGFQWVLIWAFVSVAWTLFLPGYVAHANHVFDAAQVRCKVLSGIRDNHWALQPNDEAPCDCLGAQKEEPPAERPRKNESESAAATKESKPANAQKGERPLPTALALERAVEAEKRALEVAPVVQIFAMDECRRRQGESGIATNDAAASWCTRYAHAEQPKLSFLGFLESNTTYPFLAATFALGIHAWLSREFAVGLASGAGEESAPAVRIWAGAKWLVVTVLLWGAWFVPNWIRTNWLGLTGRHVFSFVHQDIDGSSFLLHESRAIVICGFLVASWGEWLKVWRRAEGDREDSKLMVFKSEQLRNRALTVGVWLDQWQTHSLLLTLGFLPWTLYYWSIGPRLGDVRYYISTIIWYAVWGITWWGVSRPILTLFRDFHRYRACYECHLLAEEKVDGSGGKVSADGAEVDTGDKKVNPKDEKGGAKDKTSEADKRKPSIEAELAYVRAVIPVSAVRVVLVAVGAFVAFVAPVFKAFFR